MHLQGVRSTLPDFQLTSEDCRRRSDPHTGGWARNPPAHGWLSRRGTSMIVIGINIDRFADVKIVEHWGDANMVGMRTQFQIRFVHDDSAR